ncbi:hypothetical protein BWQ96_01685 [Gracilariopsis chorda]|uniref:Coilin N-terminal domain-containing protein n=1 Tax=Gracilariopsis chorda TaxID=448386 RepID=A0A2V3J236_9FLOR|nr:hypothetical protein BWQ96_01685 [Gracilariopsis chorda]|eukprot:PXF48516.1 hypothetical protein BWQ96_01685 [Gracilariopsis chorda]
MPSLSNSITTSGSDSILPQPPKRIKVKTLDLPERWLVIPTFTNTVAQLSCYIRTRLSLAEDGDYDIYLDGSLILPEETIEVVRDGDFIHVYPPGQQPPTPQTSHDTNPPSPLNILKGQTTNNTRTLPPRPPGRHPPIQLLFSQNNFRNDELESNSQGPVRATARRISTSDDAESKPRRTLSTEGKKRRNARNRRRERRRRQEAREAKAARNSSGTEHEPSTKCSVPVSQNLSTFQPVNSRATPKKSLSETEASKEIVKEVAHTHKETINEKSVGGTNPSSSGLKQNKDSTIPAAPNHETHTKDVKSLYKEKLSQKDSATTTLKNRDAASELLEEDTVATRQSSQQATERNESRPRLPFGLRKGATTISLPEVIDLLSDDGEEGETLSIENEVLCSSVKEESIPEVEGAKESNFDNHRKTDFPKEISSIPESASKKTIQSQSLGSHDNQSSRKSMPSSPSVSNPNAEKKCSMIAEGSKAYASTEMRRTESHTKLLGVVSTQANTSLDPLKGSKNRIVHMQLVQESKPTKAPKVRSGSHDISDCAVGSVESVPSISIAASEIQAATQLKPVGHSADKAVSSDLSAEINEIVKVLDDGENTTPTSEATLERARNNVSEPHTAMENRDSQSGRSARLPTDGAASDTAIAATTETSKSGRNLRLNQKQGGELQCPLSAGTTSEKSKKCQLREQSTVLKGCSSGERRGSRTEAAEKPSEDESDRKAARHDLVHDVSKKRVASDCVVGDPSYKTSDLEQLLVRKKQRQDASCDFSNSKTTASQRTLPPESTIADENRSKTGKVPNGAALDGGQGSVAVRQYISELLNEILGFREVGRDGCQSADRNHARLLSRVNNGKCNDPPTRTDITALETHNRKDLCAIKKAALVNLREVAGDKELTCVQSEHNLSQNETPILVGDRSNCTPNAENELKASNSPSRKRRRKFSSVSSALRYAREHDMLQGANAIKSKGAIDLKKSWLTNDSEGKPAKRKKRRKSKGKPRPEDMLYEEQYNESVLLGFDACIDDESLNNAHGTDDCLLPPLSLLESTVDMRDPALFISNDVAESPKTPKNEVLNRVKTRHSPEQKALHCAVEKSAGTPRTCPDATDHRSPHGTENAVEVSGISRSISGTGKSLATVAVCDEIDLAQGHKDNTGKGDRDFEERTDGHGRPYAEKPVQTDSGKYESSKQPRRVGSKVDQSDRSEANSKQVQRRKELASSQHRQRNPEDDLTMETDGEKEKRMLAASKQLADEADCAVNVDMDHEPNTGPSAVEHNDFTTIVERNPEVEECSYKRDSKQGSNIFLSSTIYDGAGSENEFHGHSWKAQEALNRYREKEQFFDDLVSLMINTTVELEFVCKKLFSLKNKEENDECSL